MSGPHPPAAPAFRAEVARLRSAERRRSFPMGLQVGAPEGPRTRLEVPWPVPGTFDQGLRFDLAVALVDGLTDDWSPGAPVWGWVTRPGVPEVHDDDLGWLAAVVRAFGVHGLSPAGFRAVTRTGWVDLLSGEHRVWKRLRS